MLHPECLIINTPLPLSMAFIFSSKLLHFVSSSLHMLAKTAGDTWHSPAQTTAKCSNFTTRHHFTNITLSLLYVMTKVSAEVSRMYTKNLRCTRNNRLPDRIHLIQWRTTVVMSKQEWVDWVLRCGWRYQSVVDKHLWFWEMKMRVDERWWWEMTNECGQEAVCQITHETLLFLSGATDVKDNN